jgi:hypothetical protein
MKPCVAALMTKPSAAQRSCQKGVQAKAAIRAEVMSWGLTDATIDPGEQLLRLVTRSAARAEMYTQELKFSASLEPAEPRGVNFQDPLTEAGKQFRRVNGHLHLRSLRDTLLKRVALVSPTVDPRVRPRRGCSPLAGGGPAEPALQ